MSNPMPVSQDEVNKLFAEKGELITQLEIAQNKLNQVNFRLNQLLGLQNAQVK